MTNPNSRQALHERIHNDFGYHKANEATIPLHEEARTLFANLAHWVADYVPEGRDQSLCITELEMALMRANKGIATNLAPLE